MKILAVLLLLLVQSFSLAKAMTDDQIFASCKESLTDDIWESKKDSYCYCLTERTMDQHGGNPSMQNFLEVQEKESDNCN